MTAVDYGVAILAVGVGALVQGTIGFGFGLLVAPIIALLDERLVPGSVLVLGLAVASVIAWQERGALDWRGIKWALVGRVIGTLAGALAVTRLDPDQLAVVLGGVILLAVVLSVAGWQVRPTPPALVGAGAVSGVMGALTSIGGPPMALVYQRERAARLRSTLAGFFLFGSSFALVVLALSGEVRGRHVVDALLLVPGMAVGLVASRYLGRYLDHDWTRPAVLALSSVAAITLIAVSLT